jgi:hypothetical protein
VHRRLLLLALMAGVAYADSPTLTDCQLQALGYASSPRGDEILFNAGVCFEDAKAVRRGMQTLDLLVLSYPNSKLAKLALSRTAAMAVEIGRLEDAAVRSEEYARRYAGETDAPPRMDNAIRLRTALGDQRSARDDTTFYIKTWGRWAPDEAAAAMLALALGYEAPAERGKALRTYIDSYGSVADTDQVAIAYARLGEALWQSACPVTPIDGLCIKLVVDRHRASCEPSEPRAVVVARKPALRKQALEAFARTVKLGEAVKGGDAAPRHALAIAKLGLADDELERTMAIEFPSHLDFDATDREVNRRSVKAFDAWMMNELSTSHSMRDKYAKLLELDDPEASVVAAARTGEVALSFRRKLVTSEIPRGGIRGKEARDAYCRALADGAEPLADGAGKAFATCAAKAGEAGVYNETVQMCLREVGFVEDEVEPAVTLPLPELDALRALPPGDTRRKQVAADIEDRAELALSQSHDLRPFIVLAMLALETGRPILANAYMSLASDDKNPLALAGRAVVSAARGNWGQAAVAADQALVLAPKTADFARIAAMIDLRLGRWEAAGERLDGLDESYDVILARAIIARALGDPQHAEQLYLRAIAVDGARPEAHFDLARLYELHTNPRDPGRASDEYKRAAALCVRRR